jgi:hypothetical protein
MEEGHAVAKPIPWRENPHRYRPERAHPKLPVLFFITLAMMGKVSAAPYQVAEKDIATLQADMVRAA